MTGEDAVDFVVEDQGEPEGWEWRLPEVSQYQVVDAPLADDSMPYILDDFEAAVKEATRLGGRVQPVPPARRIGAWGLVIPDDYGDPHQFLPETTPWNGRGRGEPPDGDLNQLNRPFREQGTWRRASGISSASFICLGILVSFSPFRVSSSSSSDSNG